MAPLNTASAELLGTSLAVIIAILNFSYCWRILHQENPYPEIFSDRVIQLFGANFVAGNALPHKMETLFFMLRWLLKYYECCLTQLGTHWSL